MNKNKNERHQMQNYEKAYNQDQCQEFLKDALDEMKLQNYNFGYSSYEPFEGRPKQMIRNQIYLRFKCRKCRKERRQKRFTSTLGTASIKFEMQERSDLPYKKLLVFHFRIFRMECLQCGYYANPQIYDSQLEIIQKRFCQIVGQILKGIKPKRYTRNKNPKKVPDLRTHRHFECEACHQKKCHTGPCPIDNR